MWKILDSEDLCKSLLNDPEFLADPHNKIDTFLKDVNEFISILYTFFVQIR
jgi:hypothetical protein